MELLKKPIDQAIDVLKRNLEKVVQISEWAEAMNYQNDKSFRRDFIRHYRQLPGKALIGVRLLNIIATLIENRELTCNEIAWKYSMTDHNQLNSFIRYHTKLSPSEIKNLNRHEWNRLQKMIKEKFLGKIYNQN